MRQAISKQANIQAELAVLGQDQWLHTFIALFFIIFSHLSYNKSAKFLVLNVYFAEDNHGEKEDKIKLISVKFRFN